MSETKSAVIVKPMLKKLLFQRGITQTKLCLMTGLSKDQISRLANFNKSINAKNLETVANALNVSPGQLITDYDFSKLAAQESSQESGQHNGQK